MQDVPFAAVYDRDGKAHRVVSLDNALRQPTHAELVRAARNALDVDRHAERYPNINNYNMRIDGQWQPSPRRDRVERAVEPIAEALGSEQLTATDRERLVNLGHRVMSIANGSPENVHRGAVLNPEEAEQRAYAEETHRQKPDGLLGWNRKRNLEAAALAAYRASDEYRQSLRQSQLE